MHSCFRSAFLAVVLSVGAAGTVCAGADLTTAQYQQLVSAAQSAHGDKTAQVTLTIGTVAVVFNVTRDAVGGIIARPVPGPGTADLTISQVSIAATVNEKGAVVPATITVISNSQAIQSYNVQLNPDGTLAAVTPVGTFAPVGGGGGAGGGLAGQDNHPPSGGGGGGGYVTGNQFDNAGAHSLPPGAGTTDVSPTH